MSSERADVHKYNVVDFFILNLSEIAVLIYIVNSLMLSSIMSDYSTDSFYISHFNY